MRRDRIVEEHVLDDPNQVDEGDPADPLAAVTHATAEAEPEHRQHLAKRPALGAEYQTDPQVGHANAPLHCGRTGRFPIPTDLGEKPPTGRSFLALLGVATVSIEANSRCANHHSRRPVQLGEPFGEKSGARNAAVTDRRFPLLAPAPREDILASEMNYCVGAFRSGRIEATRLRIPEHPVAFPTHQPLNAIATLSKPA